MPYCVRCGVKLQDHDLRCPLCDTEVVLPDEPRTESPLPEKFEELEHRVVRSMYVTVFSFALLLPVLICFNVDFATRGGLTWSPIVALSVGLLWFLAVAPFSVRRLHPFYRITIICWATAGYLAALDWYIGSGQWAVFASGGVITFWGLAIVPFLFKKRRAMFSLIIDLVLVTGFLFVIEYTFAPGTWFLPLGLPLVLWIALLVFAEILVGSRIKGQTFKQVSFLLLGIGVANIGIDLIVSTYLSHEFSYRAWSVYVVITAVIGALVFYRLGRQEVLLEDLKRRFHVWE